jgi:aminobenzoyl-glutamate utilization protein A
MLHAEIAAALPEAIEWRRTLHRCPQPAWLELFATAFIAEKLAAWGYEIKMGRDIIAGRQLLPPTADELARARAQALAAGAAEQYLAPAAGGHTGVIAILKGDRPGPTVGFRFDIDANETAEATDPGHRPAREGFASQNPGAAHMCGHDAHAAIGLLFAKHLAARRAALRGTVKLIFQPNEENLGGAAAIVASGLIDDLDYLFGGHVGLALTEIGHICLNIHSFMALSRFEITYSGRPSHAALRPDQGRNALLGSCAAIANLYAIARHGHGASRINVGYHQAGTTWNVIPDRAYFRMETRGVSNEINAYMVEQAHEIIRGAAQMYGLGLDIKPAAVAVVAESTPALAARGEKVAAGLPSVSKIVPSAAFNASEDFTVLMQHVQSRGGQALAALFGTPVGGGHHNAAFDIDEQVIANAAEFYAAMLDAVQGDRP